MNTAEILELPVAEIGPGPLVRADRIDMDHATLLIDVLDLVPPIIVRETGNGWSLIDGQHRLSASKLAKRETVRAVVVALDDAEALEAAIKANTSHGKGLTLAERKAAADKLIATTDWSDRRIAEACGLNRATVGKQRPDDSGGRNKPRVGRDGKTYDSESPAVRAARERREQEAAAAAEPVDRGMCVWPHCADKATAADGMCAWHRGKAKAEAASHKIDQDEAPSSPSPGRPEGTPATPPATPHGEATEPTTDAPEAAPQEPAQTQAHTSGAEGDDGTGTAAGPVAPEPLSDQEADDVVEAAAWLTCLVPAAIAEAAADPEAATSEQGAAVALTQIDQWVNDYVAARTQREKT